MTDLPVDDVKTTKVDTLVKMSPSWSPSYVNKVHNPALQMSLCEKRPAMVRNPPDKWGRRQPSPWTHDWFRYVTGLTSFETAALPGRSTWFHPAGSEVTPHLGFLSGSWNDLDKYGPSPFTQINADNTAKTKVLNEVASKKWDLGVTARELKETGRLALDLSKQVLHSARKLEQEFGQKIAREVARSRNMARRPTVYERRLAREATRQARERAATYEAARNQWMQYNFGLRPLARDVQDACYALDHLRGSPIAVYGKAGHSSDYRTRRIVTPTNCRWNFVEQVDGVFEAHYSVQYASPTEGVSPFSTLGLDNPWSVGYETARLSWLLDYAIGAGDWISSWAAVNGLTFVSGTKSTIWRAASSAPEGAALAAPSDEYFVKKPLIRYSVEAGRFRRELINSPITPAFAPQIKSNLGLVQLANSLFVLSQFAGRRRGGGL